LEHENQTRPVQFTLAGSSDFAASGGGVQAAPILKQRINAAGSAD
jgi:hypothetical protein